ncbi:MAG: ABC transporter substrate-binding protein, partial [Lachnospiraceae bacterium]|nr:ABC transporter substrate-binding protein [Lachnospiraceae bacterium]
APEYKEYLEAEGEDTDLHYDVKIKAAKLLMNNTTNTFVTPVFNGSTSVRDAAGQLIENVTKAVRRKKTVDDKFIDATYEEVKSLYHLDSGTSGAGGGKKSLGPLPSASKALIGVLIGAWVIIGFFALKDKLKANK